VIAAKGSDEPGITFGRLTFSLQKYHPLEGNILGEQIAKLAYWGRLFVFRETGEEVEVLINYEEVITLYYPFHSHKLIS